MQTLPASGGLDSIITPCSRFLVPPLRGLLPLRYRPAASFSRKLRTLLIFTDKKKILPHAILRVVKGSNPTRTDSEKLRAIPVMNACPVEGRRGDRVRSCWSHLCPRNRFTTIRIERVLFSRRATRSKRIQILKILSSANSFANISIDRIPNRSQR